MVFRFGVLPRGIRLCDGGIRQRGLKNLGMTCYLNSLLQCLFHVPAFRAAIFQMTSTTDEKLAGEIEALDTSEKAFLVNESTPILEPTQACKLSDRSCPTNPPQTQLLKGIVFPLANSFPHIHTRSSSTHTACRSYRVRD